MTGDSGKDVSGPSSTGGPCGTTFAIRMHQPAVTDRRQQGGKRQLARQDGRLQAPLGQAHGVPRPECDGIKGPTVRPERDLVFGSAVQIVEYHFRQTTPREATQVLDIDRTGGRDYRYPAACRLNSSA